MATMGQWRSGAYDRIQERGTKEAFLPCRLHVPTTPHSVSFRWVAPSSPTVDIDHLSPSPSTPIHPRQQLTEADAEGGTARLWQAGVAGGLVLPVLCQRSRASTAPTQAGSRSLLVSGKREEPYVQRPRRFAAVTPAVCCP